MTIVYHHRVSIHDEDGEEQSNGEQYEEGLVQNDSFINPLQPGYEGKQRINPLVWIKGMYLQISKVTVAAL